MSKCSICNKDVFLYDKYTCNYCKEVNCADHRLPEDHNCYGNPQRPTKGRVNKTKSEGRTIIRGVTFVK